MSRAWSLALPVLTVLVVAYALLVAGVPRQVVGARVYGGPTEGLAAFAMRVEVVQRDGEHESPYWDAPLHVTASASGLPLLAFAVTNAAHGVVDVPLAFAGSVHGTVKLELSDGAGVSLVSGAFTLDGAHWAARARRRGGWIRGRDTGGLSISLAPERGAFVVGAADPLLIRVEHAGSPVSNARLTISADGAELSVAPELRSDERGRARIGFRAVDLNPTLRVEAHTDDNQSGLIDSGVPVVAGGYRALLGPSGLRVESATPRTEAFYSVVGNSGRIAGGVLSLAADGRGGTWGTFAVPALPQPSWLVVSSEVDEHSPAAIGWPLDAGTEPAQTFDVPESLLLDGLPAAFAREQARRSRVRWLTATFIGLAFALSVVQLVLRVRAADRDIARHLRDLESGTAARIAPRGVWPLLGALLLIGLGFVALGLIVAARSH